MVQMYSERDYNLLKESHKKNKRYRKRIVFFRLFAGFIIGCCIGGLLIFLPGKGEKNKNHGINVVKGLLLPSEHLIEVPCISQYPDLPTGCETCAAVMALDYLGIKADTVAFASMLPRNSLTSDEQGRYGESPENYFIGNPFENEKSFGCFEQVIINTVNKQFANVSAEKVTGTLDDFCRKYICKDQPVIVWATMGMGEITHTSHWRLPDGEEYYWPGGEHCLLLVGYDKEYYYFNDSMEGTVVSYDRKISEEMYEQMGSRAVIIKLPD